MSGSMLRAARSAAARGDHVKHDSHNSTSQISLIPPNNLLVGRRDPRPRCMESL